MNYLKFLFLAILLLTSCQKENSNPEQYLVVTDSQIQASDLPATLKCRDCEISHNAQEPQLSTSCVEYVTEFLGGNTISISTQGIITNFYSITNLLGEFLEVESYEILTDEIHITFTDESGHIENAIEIGFTLLIEVCPFKVLDPICPFQSSGIVGLLENQIQINGSNYPICDNQLCIETGEFFLKQFISISSFTLDLCNFESATITHHDECQEIEPVEIEFISQPNGKQEIRFFFDEPFWICLYEAETQTFNFFFEHNNPLI